MRRLVATALLLLFSLPAPGADENPDLFSRANELYRQQEYEEAADLYVKMLSEGFRNGIVEYNLGNALYRLGRIGEARMYYERAARLIPDEPDILSNIRFIESRFLKQTLWEENFTSMDRVLWSAVSPIPRGPNLAIGMLAYLLLNLLFTLYIFRPKMLHPAIRWGLAILLIIVAAAAFTVATVQEMLLADHSYGIVIEQDADVSSEPGENAPSRFPAPEGMKVLISRSQGRWLEIVLPNGSKGWVPSETVGII